MPKKTPLVVGKVVTPAPAQFSKDFPIVGVGASAGGTQALTELFENIPADTGMAFVVVQHLNPTQESLSTEILARIAKMQVMQIKNNMRVEPNHIYVLPPNFSVAILHGVLTLLPRDNAPHMSHMAIDFFFQSLAEDQRGKALGIILSGTASDGTEGLKAIKAEGGFTCAQEPSTAKYDGMPRSAIAARIVDLVLPPKGLAHELARMSKHPYFAMIEEPVDKPALSIGQSGENDHLTKIFILLQKETHVDFSNYKYTTIHRRIQRRIVVKKLDNIASYAKYLQNNPDEVKALFNDILINVTSFFRDPDAFKALKDNVFPKIMQNRPTGKPFRIWIPGCSTGEEVYSIAILLLEFLGDTASHTPIQIFATDISDQALQRARIGIYSESQINNLSADRLKRFFDVNDGGYKIKRMIRDLCLFSRHDVTRDPPFAKLDLITCRNLLIYFSPGLQKHVIPIFHYALNPKGFLLLGGSEGTSGFSALFKQEDKAYRIYSKLSTGIQAVMPINFPRNTFLLETPISNKKLEINTSSEVDFQTNADQIALAEYAPPGVIINSTMDVLQIRGRVGLFFEPAPGQPSYNLLKMARSELLPVLRVVIQAARKQNIAVNKQAERVNIRVIPLNPVDLSPDRKYLVLFENIVPVALTENSKPISKHKTTPNEAMRIAELEHELQGVLEYQQSLAEEYDTTQDDLTATNEELQSINEEFQSTNEELETAKEELQSANEELTTVNDELQSRNLDLSKVNDDLTNLLGTVEIAIIMIGNDHRIRRFTPKAGIALNLIPSDIGRPVGDIKTNFDIDLDVFIAEVIDTLTLKELEIKDRQGKWSRIQIRPYKTMEHKIDGAVIAIVDINDLKKSFEIAESAKCDAEKANRAKDLFLATLSHELRTPLTAILAWGQILQAGKFDAEKIQQIAAKIVESSQIQEQLIDDLLEVSRIILGEIDLNFIEIDPSQAIDEAITSLALTATEKSIQIETFIDREVGTIMVDERRLQQILWNLLTNAIKFSASGTKILIKLEKIKVKGSVPENALIKIVDTGTGISPEFLPHIFDHFSQEDKSSIRNYSGLGLGLAIVKNLVEVQGGYVIAESRGKNKGASFSIIFPIKSDKKILTHNPSPESHNSHDSLNRVEEKSCINKLNGIRVLLVEDEKNTREAIAEILLSFGAKSKAVKSVSEALVAFPKFKPDVLLSDIGMPGQGGYDLIKKIRALEDENPTKGGHPVPAIALTAFASREDSERAIAAGFQVYITKPFLADHLIDMILQAIEK
jgi:two-component system CheB/CheR fusion protein